MATTMQPSQKRMGASSYRPAYAARPWARPGPRSLLGNPGSKEGEQLGLSVLAALSIAGLHSAVCPSYFTLKTFGSQPEARARAMEGLWISLGLSTIASGAIWLVFDSLTPAIVSEVTAFALFGIGVWAIRSSPPETIPPIEKQQVATG